MPKEMKKNQVPKEEKQVLKEMKKKQMKQKQHPSEKFSARKKKHHPYPPLKIMHELQKLSALF